jgi:hypothetical protein
MAKFQMVGSENPNTIADVSAEVDIDSFRKDSNWYELVEEVVQKPAKAPKQPKVINKDEE